MASGTPVDYARPASTYDRTRGASPTLVRLLAVRLGPGGGRRLLDVAGGTGNYARALAGLGFVVTVLDREFEMVRRSAPKLGPGRQVVGDAQALPFGDRAFDCLTLIAALHLLPSPASALAESRRVVRDGPLVVQAFTRENMAPTFVFDYFPGWAMAEEAHPTEADVVAELRRAGFSRVEVDRFAYADTVDANLHALHMDASLLADPAHLANTSFFQRLPKEVRRAGLERLAADLASGVLARRVEASMATAGRTGHGTVFAAWP